MEQNGICEYGEICLYHGSEATGALPDFSSDHDIDDYGDSPTDCYKFISPGAGQGQCIKNNAESLINNSGLDVRTLTPHQVPTVFTGFITICNPSRSTRWSSCTGQATASKASVQMRGYYRQTLACHLKRVRRPDLAHRISATLSSACESSALTRPAAPLRALPASSEPTPGQCGWCGKREDRLWTIW